MIILGSTSDKLQVITGAAVAATVTHVTWIDNNAGSITPGRTNTTVSTAATTDVVAAPAASTYRNIKFVSVRNTNASTSNTITLQHTDGTTVVILWQGVLGPGMMLQLDDAGRIALFANGGAIINSLSAGALNNFSTANQGAGFATDTYVTGSNILIPTQRPRAGTVFQSRIAVVKTAAGTATPIVNIRYGTAATTADTALCTFTFGAGTAAADTGVFVVTGMYRSVGSGTSAVLQGTCQLDASAAAGISSTSKAVVVTSSGHDSTTANTYLGISINGGTSASWTISTVISELMYI